MNSFRDKVVFITGGSSGIGLSTARLAVQAGAHVAIGARDALRLKEAMGSLESLKTTEQRIHAWTLDVTDASATEAVAASVVKHFGRCDVVIANAGVSHPASTLETPLQVYEQLMRTNYLGTVHTVRSFLPHLLKQGQGRVGIVSSVLGFMGLFGYSAYAASKFAQVGFAESLRHELVDTDISLTLLFPPDTDTPQLKRDQGIMPPETRALSETVATLEADFVARAFLKAIDRGQWEVVPGGMGKLVRFCARHMPGLWRSYMDMELRSFRKRQQKRAP